MNFNLNSIVKEKNKHSNKKNSSLKNLITLIQNVLKKLNINNYSYIKKIKLDIKTMSSLRNL